MSDIQIIISKYLADADECTPQEKLELEKFLNASEENRQHFDELKALWGAGADVPGFYPDADRAWESLKKRLPEKNKVEKEPTSFWLKIAAAAVLIIGSGILFNYLSAPDNRITPLAIVIHSQNNIKRVVLPDSSVVWLNKKSVLAWDEHFGNEERTVFIVGEAYFEVTHDKQKPFIVYTNYGTKTKVLGTSFNLKSRILDTTVFLDVVTGIVEFASVRKGAASHLIVKKGEAAHTSYTDPAIYKSHPQENILAWKERKLSFSNTSLKEMCHTLEEYFSIRIQLLSPAVASCHFTGTFQSPTINDILEVLNKTMSLQAEIRDNTVFLSGKGCVPDITTP